MIYATKSFAELQARAEQIRFDFLKSDLATCFTFTDFVETELMMPQDRSGAEEAFERAERGYDTIRYLLSDIKTDEYRIELQTQLDRLRKRLNDVASRFTQSLHG